MASFRTLPVILIVFWVGVAFCTLGFDIDIAIPEATFSCLKGLGYTFAIVQCYESGKFDSSCPVNVASAHAVGLTSVDIYVQPCANQTKLCPTATAQVNDLVAFVRNSAVKFERLWLSVEYAGSVWSSSLPDNRVFFEDFNTATKKAGLALGVYTSLDEWTAVMGAAYTNTTGFPLWYAQYDNNQTFDDFKPFAGWKAPYMKQYNQNLGACATRINVNWYPSTPVTTGNSAAATSTAHASTTHVAATDLATAAAHAVATSDASTTAHATSTHALATDAATAAAHLAATTDAAATTTHAHATDTASTVHAASTAHATATAHASTTTAHASTTDHATHATTHTQATHATHANNNAANHGSTYGIVEPENEQEGGQGWSGESDFVKGKKYPIPIADNSPDNSFENLQKGVAYVEDQPTEDLQIWEGKLKKKFQPN